MESLNPLVKNILRKAQPIIEDWEFSENFPITRNNFECHLSTFEFGYTLNKYKLNLLSKEDIEAGKKLSDVIDAIPHGIIDKGITGIGATTLEINSKRNSIIVMPTRALAFTKATKHPNSFYVGSKYNSFNTKNITKTDINKYLSDSKINYKKFLVVADSLQKLIHTIGENVYQEYFFMIDEVDLIQADSNYRPALENAMDYYFKFPKKSRCLVSATVNEFSNPELVNECRFELTNIEIPREISLLHTNNLIKVVKSEIEYKPIEKILIAFNGISEIRSIISLLDKELQTQCGILCSEISRKEAGEFYAILDESGILPKRIVFMTCSYFAGLDFNDTYHLITVSNIHKFYQALSFNRMTQIAGRCRIPNGVLSETIIYNTLPPDGNYYDNKVDFGFGQGILHVSNKIIEVLKMVDKLTDDAPSLKPLYDMLKKGIVDKACDTIKGENIKLIRQNIVGKYVPAYFNIDSVFEKYWLNYNYYFSHIKLIDKVQNNHTLKFFDFVDYEEDSAQTIAVETTKQIFSEIYDEYIKDAIQDIKILDSTGELDDEILKKRMRSSKRNCKTFYERFLKIYKYIQTNEIIEPLYEMRIGNNKAFKKLNNAVIFHALTPNHPFKENILHSFEQNKLYTSEEIRQIMSEIVEYHLKRTITKNIAIGLFQSIFITHRPRTSYKVLGLNPYKLTEPKLFIDTKINLFYEFIF